VPAERSAQSPAAPKPTQEAPTEIKELKKDDGKKAEAPNDPAHPIQEEVPWDPFYIV